ncbi:hypothetical protein GCM10023172_19550 [Hymenobacter ginsengisoli]|uniref:Lipoprotein n=1 Tax=Hymenobacter ginsengisoli TaxID=1051626 RepID=A0ABP8QBT8_9BACT|nr:MULTISPECIES: hypothetical protein [unclassified Hymenobacter]MBO2031485.1 hypothetical protein [Hymenobacter sp. BT559]
MFKKLLFRALPVLLLGSLTLSSCVIHEHDRGRGYGHGGYRGDHDHGRGHGYGYGYRR